MGLLHFREAERATTVAARRDFNEQARRALTPRTRARPRVWLSRHARLGTLQQDSWDFTDALRSAEARTVRRSQKPDRRGQCGAHLQQGGRNEDAARLMEECHAGGSTRHHPVSRTSVMLYIKDGPT
jgi:hypothetical protein